MKNLAILMTGLTTLCVQISAVASEKLDPNGVNYVKIEVCGDVAGKKPGSNCIEVTRYLWGPIGQARLIPSQKLLTKGERYEAYNLIINSRGCFPVHSAAKEAATYNLNAMFSVLKNGKTELHVEAHPVVQGVIDEVWKNRDAPQLLGQPTCQPVVVN